MCKLIRKSVLNITPYVPGKPIDEVKRELGLREVIKLASNENPFGASPKARARIKAALPEINRYPDGNCFRLKDTVSRHLRVKPANLLFGNGSDELIDVIIKTFVEDDEEVITSDITFLEYDIISKVNNQKVVTVPLRYFKYDLEAIKKKISKKTKVVFISNPNNPTGTYVNRLELNEFLRGISDNIVVILDEAYDIFVDADDFPGSLSLIDKKNVIVLKTFSKAYGLAGLRVGYAIARPEFIAYMDRVRQPFNVNYLAQVAAEAAINDKEFLEKTRRLTLEGKKFLFDCLNKSGIPYVPSVANFILINIGRDGVALAKEMLKYGVIVRDMKQYGLKNFIRVSIGTPKENERFIKVLRKTLSGGYR